MINLFKRNLDIKYKNISAEEFKRIQDQTPDAVVLDVRTAAEVNQGKIPETINLDVMDRMFAEKIERLDKDKTYLVYCRSGARSSQACTQMAEHGFTKLFNLQGGINRWPYKTE